MTPETLIQKIIVGLLMLCLIAFPIYFKWEMNKLEKILLNKK